MPRKALVLAGEESGNIYASRLGRILGKSGGMEVRGYSDYGFETADLAVFGFWPVFKRIFFFLGVARTMKRAIREWKPDVVVTVDYPGMNLKLAAYAKRLGIPAVHIVCPQVWAWHRNRVRTVAESLTRLLCFLPFEPAIFEGTGLQAKFIGHPLVGITAESSGGAARRQRDGNTLALLPGSRLSEIHRILPKLLAAGKIVASRRKDLRIVIPAANAKAEAAIRETVRRTTGAPDVEIVSGGARQTLENATCAAIASGTATLEAALVRCPAIVVYSVSPLLAWFARRVITGVKHVGLANVIAEKCGLEPPQPELLQEAFTPEETARLLSAWLEDPAARAETAKKIDTALQQLETSGNPMETAAAEVMSAIGG